MALDLTPALQAALQEQLPAAVGGELRTLLETAAEERQELERLRAEKERVERDKQECIAWREKSRRFDERETALNDRDRKLDERERQLDVREAVIDLRETHAKERVGEMRDVVRDVFSTRFKFTRNAQEDVVLPGVAGNAPGEYGSPSSVAPASRSESVEGEGEVPRG